MTSALVKLSRPKITDAGVRFDFTSPFTIPSTLTDMSINLQRAPRKSQARATDSYNFQISGDLWIGANAPYSNQINSRIYNASNNNTCWTGSGAKVMNEDDEIRQYVGDIEHLRQHRLRECYCRDFFSPCLWSQRCLALHEGLRLGRRGELDL